MMSERVVVFVWPGAQRVSEKQQHAWITAGLAIWLAGAVLAGALGALEELRPPAPQVILIALTAGLIAAGALVPWVRRWAEAIDLRAVVALHLTRFVGFYFLVLYRRGELPYAFAVPGGWGDIVVATLALVLLLALRPSGAWGRRLYLGWNVLGLFDIVAVVATAAAEWVARPESMRPLLRLPLSLLITFLVPLIVASHVLIFVRLVRGERRPGTDATAFQNP
jgi:hypothetical protein